MIRVIPAMLPAAILFLAGCGPVQPTAVRTSAASPRPSPSTQPRTNPPPPTTTAPSPPRQDPPTVNPPAQPPANPPAPPPDPSPDEVKQKERRSLMEVKFGNLKEMEVSKPFYSLVVNMKNVSGKDIANFSGGFWFYDENGKDIYLVGDVGGAVKAGETVPRSWTPSNIAAAAIAYMKAHPDKVKVEFEAGRIEYADGTKKDYDKRGR